MNGIQKIQTLDMNLKYYTQWTNMVSKIHTYDCTENNVHTHYHIIIRKAFKNLSNKPTKERENQTPLF